MTGGRLRSRCSRRGTLRDLYASEAHVLRWGVIAIALWTVACAGTPPPPSAAPRQWYREGSGRTLVMLGGGTYGAAMFAPHAHELARDFDVIRVQTLNVQIAEARTEMPLHYSVSSEARALRKTLAYLGVTGPVDLVGVSYGAVVALHFAVVYPGQVRSVTLFEPPEFWLLPEEEYERDPALREMRELMSHMKGSVTPSDQQLLRFRCILGPCPSSVPVASDPSRAEWDSSRLAMRGLGATFRHHEDRRRLQQLARSKPILLLTGSETVGFHRRINERLVREMPTIETAEIQGGHSAPRVNSSAFIATLRTFLSRHP
ncbi:MAG: alpha/beta fold hydrolase [Thermoanaerobaculia bacterium]